MNTENFKSFEAAVAWHKEATGKDYSKLPDVTGIPEEMGNALVSQYKLWVIADAARESKKLSRGFYPFWWMPRAGSGSGFSFYDSDFAGASSDVGARLEFPDRQSSDYAAKQHFELYQDVYVISES